ncbi:MAG: oligopeptide/dipeptide transporter, ATPase subunit [Oscillospiraceae bacterium]|nr:oligopeptide/dipeptide transporter, ATPase subunit [Oscillospiraceae bacterium]
MSSVIPSQVPFNEKLEDIMLVNDLKMHFPVTKGLLRRQIGSVKAVDGVSFAVKRGKTLGIVGESGSGKSTIGNCLLSRLPITGGDIMFEGVNMRNIPAGSMRKMRKTLQMITQDPFASLDPRFTIRKCISEGIEIHNTISGKQAIDEKVSEMLNTVGLRPEFADRFPHEFSGGQRQRISIARALALQPSFIVCDEVVSALDVSIQAQIVSLLMKLQQEIGLTYVFIGHDLSVVRFISHEVAVMYLGKIMEITSSDELYDHPLHPYTQALISAAPIPNPDVDRARERILLKGEIPSPMNPPKGCNFCTRCPHADNRCREEEPVFADVGNHHFVACHKVTGR